MQMHDDRSLSDDLLHMRRSDPLPNRFVLPRVKKGRVFEVCVAGRSARFEIYAIVLVKCEGHEVAEMDTCRGGKIGLLDVRAGSCM